MCNTVMLTRYLDICLQHYDKKKALDYDGNGLPRSFKSILWRIFEKNNNKT